MEQYELDAVKRITTRPARDYRTLEVRGLTPVIGAEVTGLDLTRELTDEQLTELKTAFLDHHVLVFRDQDITVEDHKRLAASFGELRPVNPPPEHGDPYILEVATAPESANVFGNGWHADGTADEEPSLGSMLHITRMPEPGSGGDTLFANMHLAYAMLSPKLKELLTGLTAIHDGAHAFRGHKIPEGYEPPVSEHPVVVRHPETDRPLLYVNPTMGASLGIKGFAAAILGGFGNIPGAILGGLAIGTIDAFAAGHFQGYSDLVTFLVFTVIIMVRPTGIFGERTVNRA